MCTTDLKIKGNGRHTTTPKMSVLYKTAGCILRDFQKKKGSLKSLVFASPVDLRAKKKIFALLCKAVARKHYY